MVQDGVLVKDDIIEFERQGYVKSEGNSNTIKKLRRKYRTYFKIFDSSVFRYHGRNPKYSSEQLFGERLIFYYDIRREKEFVDYIVKIFYDKNSQPNREMRASFTRILHYHNLCWFGCYHGGKKMELLNVKKIDAGMTDFYVYCPTCNRDDGNETLARKVVLVNGTLVCHLECGHKVIERFRF